MKNFETLTPQKTEFKPVFSLDELLKIVPICRSSIYHEIKAGRLKISKMGRRTLFLAEDVSAWLEGMRSCGT